MNSYAETAGGFNSSHGQTSRTADTQKHQNISSTWSYNGQLEGMYYSGEHQPMFVGPYEGTSKHANYPQYPSGTLHQPVPTPVVKCNEACCQHFQDRYPLNPAPLRYQPSGPVQPRYADLPNPDTRQYFTDRRTMPSLSRKKVYAENGYPSISERRFPQYVGRGQLHLDSRQQMQMMRAQYPMYPPYWGSTRGWTGPRINCPPPPSYHQSINQGTQLKIPDGTHYIDPTAQKSFGTQHRRAVGTGGGTDLIRPVPDPKRSTLDPNSQSCYEFGYPTGFVPFSEVNKIQGGSLTSQGSNASCKIPNEKQYLPHQMQYAMQSGDRSLLNCGNPMNDLTYPMNFPLPGNDSYMRSGLEDGQSISGSRKMQYDTLSKKRPDLDLRQYLATWEDDEDESTRIPEALSLGNNGAPYIVVDCRSIEGDAAAKLQERFKTTQASSSKSRSSSPHTEQKQSDEPSRKNESSDRSEGPPDFQNQTSYAPSMPTLLNDSEKSLWSSLNRDDEGVIGKGAFQPLDCSKRDNNQDAKRDSHSHNLPVQKIPGTSENSSMTLDALVSYYGDNRRVVDGGYDFVEMTERLVNNTDKTSLNNRSHMDHSLSSEASRPCDPRLQQSQLGNNPSIYNKVPSRYPNANYQHFKQGMHTDPYFNYKHTLNSNKYFGYDPNSQIVDPNFEYHKIATEFDSSRLYGIKDVSKDPRRMFHQDIDKTVESSFYDPIRKTQLPDCFQDKANIEFASVDPEQFINPAAVKKSLDQREKHYSDKSNTVIDRIDALNSSIQSEKTVLITSQNGPPEIFRVPFSPDKELSHKDNVVTLHAGDQNKSSTMTVEVPYVQQYSTLVKLSEEITRDETGNVQSSKNIDSTPGKKSSGDEFKKPTVFKLKRVPNSKEWAVEGKTCSGSSSITGRVECESATPSSSSCEIESRDLKQSGAVSSLNMPSLDDIREGEETQNNNEDHQSNKSNDEAHSSSKICSTTDETINKTKYSVPTPQMAIVQPMKMNHSNNLSSNSSCDINGKLLDSASEKMIDEGDPNLTNTKEIQLSPDSKHGNFRAHKKIQSGFSNALPNCIVSSNDDFLHSQDLNNSASKETYSPFHVFPECDVNSQLSDYFERNSGEKILDSSSRVPSSPGVDAMFEDINSSNQNQLYPTKSCNFHDLTDPNVSITNHNAHFQSFSSIFSDDNDKIGRPDGSVLQMNDKKYMKNIFDDIGHHEQEDKLLETSILNEVDSTKCDLTKKSPPIPTISLKLNETKKMWCIANKDDLSVSDDYSVRMSELSSKSSIDNCQDNLTGDAVNGLESDLAQAIQEESRRSFSKKYKNLEVHSALLDLNENEQNTCCESQNESDLNKLICEEIDKHNSDPLSNILEIDYRRNYSLVLEESSHFQKENLSQLQNANKCRSLVKYCPRNKVCKHNTLKCTDKYKTLIFDEQGKDFTHQSYLEATYVDETHSFVQDLLFNLITKCVETSEQKNKVANPVFEPENAKYSSEKPNIHTVIKFDTSGYQNKTYKLQENILTTTKVFIQHEKETCNNSVIKVLQSENYGDKKMIRSIFSPQSEDGNLEDQSKFSDINKAVDILEDPIDAVGLLSNRQALDLSYKRNQSNIPTSSEVQDSEMIESSVSISCKNDTYKGGSKDPCGSKTINHLLPPSFHNSTKDNLEIDEALELMGLATSKPIDIDDKNDDVEASLSEELVDESLDSMHNTLERAGSPLPSSPPTSNKKVEKGFKEQVACPETVPELQSTVSEKVYGNVHTKTLSDEPSNPENKDSSLYETKINGSCLFENDDICEPNGKETQPELGLSVSLEKKVIEFSSTNSDFSQNNQVDYESPPLLQEHIKRKLNSESIALEIPPSKLIKTSDVDTKKPFSSERDNLNANAKHVLVEDIESRLEMSVIVRNKSCSNRVYKDENLSSFNIDISREENDSQLLNSLEPVFKNVITKKGTCFQIPKDDDTVVNLENNRNPLSPSNQSVNIDFTKNVEIGQTTESEETTSSCNVTYAPKSPRNFVTNSSYLQSANVKPPYCVGESIFLCIDEASSYLKLSRLSYFYEFKRRKWKRYCKSPLTLTHDENRAPKNCTHRIFNGYDPKSSDNNHEGLVPEVVPSTKDSSNNVTELTQADGKGSFGSQELLEDKSLSLACIEKQNFCVRRDSLKILEPEAVLKDLFSPDSASDESESKENECPTDAQHHIKQLSDVEHLSFPNQTSIIQYNSVLSASKQKDDQLYKKESILEPLSNSDSDLFSKYKKQDSSESKRLEQLETSSELDTLRNKEVTLNESSDSLEKAPPDLIDITCIQNKLDDKSTYDTTSINYQTESKETQKTVIYCGPDSNCNTLEGSGPAHINIKDFHVASGTKIPPIELMSLGSPDHCEIVKPHYQPLPISSLIPSHHLGENTFAELSQSKVSDQIHDFKIPYSREQGKDISDSIKECINSKVANENKLENVSNNNDCNLLKKLNPGEIGFKSKDSTGGLENNDVKTNYSTPSSSNNEELHVLNGFKLNDEQTHKMCYESEDNIDTIEKNHAYVNKLILSEDINTTDAQNLLSINSVQDSLIHNHNLNKENPLQCLVEAALALENVESSILNNNTERTSKTESLNCVEENGKPVNEGACHEDNCLTPADKAIFSKFEETNYNLRASTRIVTSSSSNIIPYPKRKYTLKSSKFSSVVSENKSKIPGKTQMEKCRSRKRKCGFTYPRSKRRKKAKRGNADLHFVDPEGENDTREFSKHDSVTEIIDIVNKTEAINSASKENHSVLALKKSENLSSSCRSGLNTNSDNDFGGPLIIANSPNSDESNLLCVQENSNKMDEYVNNVNLGDLEVMSENQSLFRESSVCVDSSSDQTLENSTSLVIIFDNLDVENGKVCLEDGKKEESDLILGSINKTCSVLGLPQSDSNLNDCTDFLNAGFTSNESCIFPTDVKINVDSDKSKLKTNQYKSLDGGGDDLISKSTCDVEDNNYDISENQEHFTASCYEELNENLVNDIGNWPFVEEEVAEFNEKNELFNKIPEEGRKIELKCSLPWKKIFNISRKKKSKESKKGLELGPAKVEVRLRAPSSEWKVISDFYDNASPVVKVKRLILQRDSDLSSFSEKDSEEENEQKRKSLSNNISGRISPSQSRAINNNLTVSDDVLNNVTVDDNWQPVVLLKRIENLDGINLRLEPELPSQELPCSPCSSSQSSLCCDGKNSPNVLTSENEESDAISICSHHSRCSEAVTEQAEICPTSNKQEYAEENNLSTNETPVKVQLYESYSPSNCNNTFTGEKLYSPSDPHFSPDTRCNDSENSSSSESISYNDSSSDGEDQHVKQTLKYMDTVTQAQNEPDVLEAVYVNKEQDALTPNNSYNQKEGVGIDEDLQQEDEEPLVPHHHEELGKSTSLTDHCKSSKLIETVNSLCSGSLTSIESELPNKTLAESYMYMKNVGLSPCKENDQSSQGASGVSMDSKANVKRKMPKNFFVRRRLKKHIRCNESPYENSQLVKGDTKSTFRPFTFSSSHDSMANPLAITNQRDPTSSQSSSESKNEKSSENNEHQSNSESDMSLIGDSSRLHSAYGMEASLPVGHNESPASERFEVKQRLRDGGRGLKRPSEGHSKGDTKRRRKKLKRSYKCQECNIQFEKKEELARHNTYRHTRRRELHHCLLCQRSFSSAVRHSLHVQGRSHRHLELMQRHTMHAMHHLLVGGEFPLIPPLSRAELRTLQWRPVQPGYSHFYHQLTPLQAALQEHNTDVSEDALSEDRMPND